MEKNQQPEIYTGTKRLSSRSETQDISAEIVANYNLKNITLSTAGRRIVPDEFSN